jgi:glucose-1-phosphate thymidylyltransferase
LMPLTEHLPKPLVELNGKPIIHYCIMNLIEMGVTEIGIVINMKHFHDFYSIIGSGRKYGTSINISYIRQDEPKGIAHAISMARDFIGNSKFITILGDNIIEEKLLYLTLITKMESVHSILTLKQVVNPEDYGIAEVNFDAVIRVEEKPKVPTTNNAIMGVYAFSPKIFEAIDSIEPSARGEYEITDAIQWLINKELKVLYVFMDKECFDVGTIDRFNIAEKYLQNKCK